MITLFLSLDKTDNLAFAKPCNMAYEIYWHKVLIISSDRQDITRSFTRTIFSLPHQAKKYNQIDFHNLH